MSFVGDTVKMRPNIRVERMDSIVMKSAKYYWRAFIAVKTTPIALVSYVSTNQVDRVRSRASTGGRTRWIRRAVTCVLVQLILGLDNITSLQKATEAFSKCAVDWPNAVGPAADDFNSFSFFNVPKVENRSSMSTPVIFHWLSNSQWRCREIAFRDVSEESR